MLITIAIEQPLCRRMLAVVAAISLAAIGIAGCSTGDEPEPQQTIPLSTVPLSTVPPTPDTAPCGITLAAPAITEAIASLAPYPVGGTDVPWSVDNSSFEGNYDPCAAVSAVVVTIEGATGSSPEHALLFHDGEFVRTATPEPAAFVGLDEAASSDEAVVLTYREPGSCTACTDGATTAIEYRWDGEIVETDLGER